MQFYMQVITDNVYDIWKCYQAADSCLVFDTPDICRVKLLRTQEGVVEFSIGSE